MEQAILAGDDRTGACLAEVVDELDAGDVYAMRGGGHRSRDGRRCPRPAPDAGTALLVRTLDQGYPSRPPEPATHYAEDHPEDLHLDWTRPVGSIDSSRWRWRGLVRSGEAAQGLASSDRRRRRPPPGRPRWPGGRHGRRSAGARRSARGPPSHGRGGVDQWRPPRTWRAGLMPHAAKCSRSRTASSPGPATTTRACSWRYSPAPSSSRGPARRGRWPRDGGSGRPRRASPA